MLGAGDAEEFLDRYTDLLEIIGAGYTREGKQYLTLAVGCTGGKHRSVVMAAQFAERLGALGIRTNVVNRDLGGQIRDGDAAVAASSLSEVATACT